jgi:hypothetical protein
MQELRYKETALTKATQFFVICLVSNFLVLFNQAKVKPRTVAHMPIL